MPHVREAARISRSQVEKQGSRWERGGVRKSVQKAKGRWRRQKEGTASPQHETCCPSLGLLRILLGSEYPPAVKFVLFFNSIDATSEGRSYTDGDVHLARQVPA